WPPGVIAEIKFRPWMPRRSPTPGGHGGPPLQYVPWCLSSSVHSDKRHSKGSTKMDELVKRISEKTGISEDQARSAVNVVSNFLKEKLPAPIAGQVDNVLSGVGGMTDNLGEAAAKAGNIFGGS